MVPAPITPTLLGRGEVALGAPGGGAVATRSAKKAWRRALPWALFARRSRKIFISASMQASKEDMDELYEALMASMAVTSRAN